MRLTHGKPCLLHMMWNQKFVCPFDSVSRRAARGGLARANEAQSVSTRLLATSVLPGHILHSTAAPESASFVG